jgi:N-acetylglucosamine-6-phosphate deacetylase
MHPCGPSMNTANAYVDLQVNGYAGVDFNADNLSVKDLHRACERLRADGVERALATIITSDLDAMARRIRRVIICRGEDPLIAATLAGVHVEGPFIRSEAGYVGAHPAAAAMQASIGAAARLVDAGEGLVRIVTLAPECDPQSTVTKWLVERGVRVSAGHCDPTLDQLERAIDAGLSMFTHLGNGCPLLLHRHDNIIQRVLSLASRLWITFIADGVHIPWAALKNYLAIVSVDRAIVVTDAIAAAGRGPGVYSLAGQQVIVDDRLATWTADRSHLVGSASTMSQVAANLASELQIPADAIDRMTRVNPAVVLGD